MLASLSSLTKILVARRAVCLPNGSEAILRLSSATFSSMHNKTHSAAAAIYSNTGLLNAKNAPLDKAVLEVASAAVAHPSKVHLWDEIEAREGWAKYAAFKAQAAGQDAFYASDDGLLMVADGVGAWSDAGAVSRLSRTLVNNVAEAWHNASGSTKNNLMPRDLLTKAYNDLPKNLLTHASSTAVVGIVKGRQLHVANLGDSGMRVFRQDRIVYASAEQQHFANCPYQLGGESTDGPRDAQISSAPLQPGDIIIGASDGLYDNVFDEEIAELLKGMKGKPAALIAKALLHLTIDLAYPPSTPRPSISEDNDPPNGKQGESDKKEGEKERTLPNHPRKSPFATKYGIDDWEGGKPDDISIVVAVVL